LRITEWNCSSSGESAFAGLVKPCNHAYVAGECGGASEAGWIAGFGDIHAAVSRPMPSIVVRSLPDFMRIEPSFDVSLKVSRSATEQINVFTY
jgi:hypothetical protein